MSDNTPNNPSPPPSTPTSPLTVAAFQQHIRDRYYTTDAERGTPGTFMWLIEEIGELATTLHKVNGQGGSTSGGSTHEDLEAEFADVIAWLTTLANINNIDLETALHKKYFQNGGPKGTK